VCGNFSLFFFIPQYLQNVFGFSSLEAGVAFVPFTGAQFGMMYLMPGLVHRFGNRKVLMTGLLLAIISTLWISWIVAVQAPFFPQMFILLTIMGIGAGMAFQPLTAMGLSDVDPHDAGAASGLINVAHQSGSSMGLAILISVFDAAIRTDQPSKMHFAHAISSSILGSVFFVTSALIVTLICFLPASHPAREKALTDS
jgi:MFS family permease